jgi:predicted transcriptional regulator
MLAAAAVAAIALRSASSPAASGLTGPETASRLFVSPATVRTHVQNAREALGAKTSTQAVAEALIRGEIDWPSPDGDS